MKWNYKVKNKIIRPRTTSAQVWMRKITKDHFVMVLRRTCSIYMLYTFPKRVPDATQLPSHLCLVQFLPLHYYSSWAPVCIILNPHTLTHQTQTDKRGPLVRLFNRPPPYGLYPKLKWTDNHHIRIIFLGVLFIYVFLTTIFSVNFRLLN